MTPHPEVRVFSIFIHAALGTFLITICDIRTWEQAVEEVTRREEADESARRRAGTL